MQVLLNRLNHSAATVGMRFVPWRCKMLLQNRVGSKPSLVLARGKLSEVDRFSYLGSFISSGGRISDKVSPRM